MDKDESTQQTVFRKYSAYFLKVKLLNQERSLMMTTFMRNVNRYLSEMQIKPSYLSMVSEINETKLNDLLNGLQEADESETVKIAQGLGKDVHFFMADTMNILSISRFDETKYSRKPTEKQKLLSSSILEFLKNVDEVMSAKIRFENIAKN